MTTSHCWGKKDCGFAVSEKSVTSAIIFRARRIVNLLLVNIPLHQQKCKAACAASRSRSYNEML